MEEAIQSSVFITSPDSAGWLQKRGFAWRKKWKRRWVALHGAEIAYMEKEPTPENARAMAITRANLTVDSMVVDEDVDGNELGFTLYINATPDATTRESSSGHSSINSSLQTGPNLPLPPTAPTAPPQQIDKLASTQPWHLRAETMREKKAWMLRLMYTIAIVRWLGSFEKRRILGFGGSGIVYELYNPTTGESFALKEIAITNQRQKQLATAEAELLKDIAENVTHPAVLQIERVLQVGTRFYLVFPICSGGELFDHIVKLGSLSERATAIIIRDVVSGLQALHGRDILHLDIKPENILFESTEPDARIKITDFGISRLIPTACDSDSTTIHPKSLVAAAKNSDQPFSWSDMQRQLAAFEITQSVNIKHVKGTVGYMSPELILCNYSSTAADVFAAGVVLYILLNGCPPFAAENDQKVLQYTVKGAYNTTNRRWAAISPEAKDLISRMLAVNPLERITCDEILKHPWIVELTSETPTNTSSPVSESGTISIPAVSPTTPVTQSSSLAASGVENLPATLHALSLHVNHLKSHKMATNLTRLVSVMNTSSITCAREVSLANEFLRPAVVSSAEELAAAEAAAGYSNLSSISNGAAAPPIITKNATIDSPSNAADVNALLNADIRIALANALDRIARVRAAGLPILALSSSSITENHNGDEVRDSTDDHAFVPTHSTGTLPGVPITDLLSLLRYLQFTPAGNDRQQPAALLFSRFLDRDGDGLVTLDDLLSAQALVLQRGEALLRLVFRVYVDAVWYPGRQINHRRLAKQTVGQAEAVTAAVAAAVNSGASTPCGECTGRPVLEDDSAVALDAALEPPRHIGLRNISAVFTRLGYDVSVIPRMLARLVELNSRRSNDRSFTSSSAGDEELRDSFQSSSLTSDNILPTSEVLETVKEGDDESRSATVSIDIPSPTVTVSNNVSTFPISNSAGLSLSTMDDEALHRWATSLRIDVDEFISMARADDILVEAIIRRPRRHVASLLRRAQTAALQPDSKGRSVASFLEAELIAAVQAGDAMGGHAMAGVGSGAAVAAVAAKLSSIGHGIAAMVTNWSSPVIDENEEDEDIFE